MTKVNELRVSDFRKIDSVVIRPGAGVVEVVGLNTHGKSSLLNAIAVAVGGKDLAPREPIRKGKDRAEIEVDTGDYRVVRTFWRQDGGTIGSDVKVFAKGGARQHSPQKFLNERLGDLTFDPMRFALMQQKDKFEVLSRFVPADVDLKQIEIDNAKDFAERTVQNRTAKNARAAADAISLPDGPPPGEDAGAVSIADELRAAHEHNAQIEQRKARRAAVERDADAKEDEAEQLKARIATLEAEAATLREKLAAAEPLPDPIDVAPIQARLATAERDVAVRNDYRMRERHREQAKAAEAEAARLSAAMHDRNNRKAQAIAAAKLPGGITFGDDNTVLLGGVPFEQASHREQIAASTAVGMALVPKREDGEELRVVLIDEASGVDADGVELIRQMAAENGFQVWLARLAASGADAPAFVIQDGRVAS